MTYKHDTHERQIHSVKKNDSIFEDTKESIPASKAVNEHD